MCPYASCKPADQPTNNHGRKHTANTFCKNNTNFPFFLLKPQLHNKCFLLETDINPCLLARPQRCWFSILIVDAGGYNCLVLDWCCSNYFVSPASKNSGHFAHALDLHINSKTEKHVQTCTVRISAILLIIDGCIIHQTRLASGETLLPAAFQVVFCLCSAENLYHLKSHLAFQTLYIASGHLHHLSDSDFL